MTVALILIGAVVLALVDVPARSLGVSNGVSPWLPPDGASVTGELDGTLSSASAALFAAPQATQSLPTTTGAVLIGTLDHELATTVWRRTVATADHDRYEVYTAGPDVRLLVRGGASIAGFAGGLLVLPHDAAPGARWQSSGTTVQPDGLQWQSSFTASTAERPDCLATAGELTVTGSHDSAGRYEVSQTWCRGRGLVRDRWVAPDGKVTAWAETGGTAPDVGSIGTGDATDAPGDPRDWTLTELHPTTVLPGSDPEPMSGAPSGPPLTTTSGLLVLQSGSDVVVLDAHEGTGPVARHRLHPGGPITAVGVFGDVVLAATMARQVVAWSAPTGAVLWRTGIDDVVHPVLARLTDDAALVALASGAVLALDLRTGAEMWRAPALVGSDFPASVGPTGAVLVAGSSGTVELREATSGAVRWTWRTEATIDGVVLGSDRAWVMTDLGLYGIDPGTGEDTVLRRAGTATLPFVAGDRLVLVRPEGVRGLDAEGREVWRRPYGCRSASAGAGGVLCWQADRVSLLDPRNGTVVVEQPVAAHMSGQLSASVSATGVWWRVTSADGSSWVVYRWSA